MFWCLNDGAVLCFAVAAAASTAVDDLMDGLNHCDTLRTINLS